MTAHNGFLIIFGKKSILAIMSQLWLGWVLHQTSLQFSELQGSC
jgi:hypothetical protein